MMSILILQFCTHLFTFLHQEVEFLQRLDLVPPCLQLLILPPRDGDIRTRAEGLLIIIRGIFLMLCSAPPVSQSVSTIMEKAPTPTLLRHYAKQALTQ